MKIDITETITRSANISENQAAEITLAFIKKQFGIDPNMWIENGDLMEKVEYTTSHKWYDNEVVRKASKEDKILLEAAKLISEKSKTI